MNRYPEYAEVNGKTFKINTDFRVAIKCNEIAENEKIGDLERSMGIICTLFGKDALDDTNDYKGLLEVALKFLSCGKGIKGDKKEKPDMDYVEDMDYIEASFMSDYKIDLEKTEMHWWKFNKYMNGLSNSELGDCCVLNRIRNLRTFDTRDIKDAKERHRIEKAKKEVELKKYKKEAHLTKEQEKSMEELNKLLGL